MNLKQIGLIMRLTTVILIASLMQVSAAGFAQRITIMQRNATLESVLKEIRKQSGYDFVYNSEVVSKAKNIQVNLKDVSVDDALKNTLAGAGLEYEIKGKTVSIKPKEPSFLDKASLVIQSVAKNLFQDPVKGKVVDEQGNPLPNASIRVKGKNAVTNTNAKGEFTIENVADDAVLVISYVGYQRLEINVKDAAMPLEIKLNQTTGELEEVNVTYSTGYQNIPKERATGSFVQIDNELINRSVSTNVIDRIIGVTSGLNYQPTGTNLGNRSNLTIRGLSTINANQRPLIVVDGFPYDESGGFENVMNNINPNDIESITVLKDAAAASIWGARSGNGVIVITTKKGKFNQDIKVGFTSNVNIGNRPELNYLPQIGSADVIELEKNLYAQGFYADKLEDITNFPSVSTVVELLDKLRKGEISQAEADAQIDALKGTDIKSQINQYLLQKSINQQYALNISGGNSRYNYYGSVGYDRNRSNSVRDDYQRLTFRMENTYKPVKGLELNGFINYVEGDIAGNGLGYQQFLNSAPYTQLADAQGNALAVRNQLREAYTDTASYPQLLDWKYRPLDELTNNNGRNRTIDVRLGTGLRYRILSGLTADVRYQFQRTLSKNQDIYNTNTFLVRDLVNQYQYVDQFGAIQNPVPIGEIRNDFNGEIRQWNIRGQLNYERSWKDHSFSVLAGAEARESNGFSNGSRIYGYDPLTGLAASNLNFGTYYQIRPNGNYSTVGGGAFLPGENTTRSLSYFANGAYTYKEKYTISGSGRMDGSIFFGIKANQRITPLWSGGLMWNIVKEDFYNIHFLPQLKLRATYGFNGNTFASASAYPTILYRLTSTSDVYPNLQYAVVSSPGNPALRWEKIRMINVGLDFGTKHNRISGNLEYYTKKGSDLIGDIAVDATVGRTTYIGNRADIKGRGVDFNLQTLNLKGRIKWTTNLLISYNTDKVIDYEGTPNVGSYLSGNFPVIGKPMYSLYSYRWAGLDPDNGDPRAYVNGEVKDYAAVSSTSKLEDLAYSGRTTPVHFGSIRNSLSYEGFSISFNIQYKYGYFFRRSSINYNQLLTSQYGHNDYLIRWQKPGDEVFTDVPSLIIPDVSSRQRIYNNSNILIENGNHIRLQDIHFSYDFHSRLTERMRIGSVKFYIYINNVGLLWKANKQDIDPDFGSQNIPSARSVAFGLNINF